MSLRLYKSKIPSDIGPTAFAGLVATMTATSAIVIYQNFCLLTWRKAQALIPSASFEIFLSPEPRRLAYLPALLQPEFNHYLPIFSALACICASVHIITIAVSKSSPPASSTSTILTLVATLFLTTFSTSWTMLFRLFTPPLSVSELFTASKPRSSSMVISPIGPTNTMQSSISLLGSVIPSTPPLSGGIFSSRPIDLETWSCGLADTAMKFENWVFWRDVCQKALVARHASVILWVVLVACLILAVMLRVGDARCPDTCACAFPCGCGRGCGRECGYPSTDRYAYGDEQLVPEAETEQQQQQQQQQQQEEAPPNTIPIPVPIPDNNFRDMKTRIIT